MAQPLSEFVLKNLTNYMAGSADPEGSVTSPPGSMYARTNGSWYKKESGSGNTGWVEITDAASINLNDLADVNITSPNDQSALIYDDGTSMWVDGDAAARLTAVEFYSEQPGKNTVFDIAGNLNLIASAQTIDAVPTSITPTIGISKIVFVVDTMTTPGTITVTGTSIDRETGAETGSDTDDIVIDATTTDATGNDALGNNKWDLTGAYITSKWFKGQVTVSTADADVVVDVYQCTFDQNNDVDEFELDTFDITTSVSNTNAEISAYLYKVDVTGSKVTIDTVADIVLDNTNFTANTWYRLRRGNIGETLVGSSDGYFIEAYFGPGPATTYFDNVTIKVWTLISPGGALAAIIPSVLDELDDVTISAVADGHYLTYDSGTSQWVNELPVISNNDDVDTAGASSGDYLYYDGADWVDHTPVISDNDDVDTSAATNGHFLRYVSGSTEWQSLVANLRDLDDCTVGSPADNSVVKFNSGSGDWEDEAIALSEASDTAISGPAADEVLKWDGADWANANVDLDELGDTTITGAAKGDILVYNGSAWVDLTVGSNDTLLTADSAEATGTKWAAPATIGANDLSDVTITGAAKGDILVYNGSAWVDLTVGANDTLLVADSGEATGAKWATRAVNDLSDVTITGASTDEVLKYNGAAWVDANVDLDELGDTSISSAANSEELNYDGSNWVNLQRYYTYNEFSTSSTSFVNAVDHTVAANRLVDGSMIKMFVFGRFTQTSGTAQTVRVNWGSQISVASVGQTGAVTDRPWAIQLHIIQFSSASAQVLNAIKYKNTFQESLNMYIAGTQDTTSTIAFRVQLDNSNGADTMYMDGCYIEYLGTV